MMRHTPGRHCQGVSNRGLGRERPFFRQRLAARLVGSVRQKKQSPDGKICIFFPTEGGGSMVNWLMWGHEPIWSREPNSMIPPGQNSSAARSCASSSEITCGHPFFSRKRRRGVGAGVTDQNDRDCHVEGQRPGLLGASQLVDGRCPRRMPG